MKEGWKCTCFEDCLQKVKHTNKLKSNLYKEEGKYPIVSQEKEIISGYWDDDNDLYHHDKPIVIFGDHTKVIKYIDFDFVLGADGTKILYPKENLNSKFFYYWLCSVRLRDLGYARHYRLLKEQIVPVPPLSVQERIVMILDAAFAKIDALKQNAQKGLQAVKDLWQSTLREELKPKEGWEATTMDGVCSITSSLVDPRLPEYKNKLHVGGSNIESYTGKLSNLLTAEQEDLVSNKFYFDQTMVLYNKIRPYLVKIAMPDFDGICSADIYPLKPKNGVITREYLYYVLNSKDFTDYAIMGSARAGMPKVNRDCLFAYSFSIPSIDEQKIIVSKLFQTASICNKLQQKLELEIAEYDALKQSILRKAFSGELQKHRKNG